MPKKPNNNPFEKLVCDARLGRVSRRRFMEYVIATGVTVPVATSLWSTHVAAATPKKGGTFRVGLHDGNTSDSLDPATTESVYMIQTNHAIRSYLTEITEKNTLGPDAATSWEASDDASEWTFKLAKGVEFHNGKSFTARDAVASLNYHRGDDSKSAAKSLLADVKEIKADDDHTLVIKMAGGNADLPYLMSDYHLVMMPSDGEGKVDISGVGTGPYKIDKHDAGVSSTMSRHANYHRSGLAHFDGLNFLVLNDINARQTALTTGEVDAVSEIDVKTAHLLGRHPDIELDEVASGYHITIPMFVDVAPFDNLDVRLALKYAIDRQELVDKVLLKHGSLGNDHPIAPSLPFWADLPQREHDIDKAKFHLKKAGAEGLKVSLSTSEAAFGGATDMALLFQASAAKAGITIDVKREPSDGYWSNVWLKKPFTVVAWGARPTPDVMFSLAYKDDADWNESHWKDPAFNKILREAKSELNSERRAEMYKQMQLLCRDEGGTIVPMFRNYVYGHRKTVRHGPDLAGNWTLDGARAYQRWWFDS